MIRRDVLPADIEDRLPRLARALESDDRVDFAYLFGSLARGRRSPTSDVDIALMLTPDVESCGALLDLVALANEALGTDEVDVVLLGSAPLMLAYRIIQGRVVLMERDRGRRARYESRILRMAWDFLPREQAILERRYGRGHRRGDGPEEAR